MPEAERIDAALARHGFSPALRPRIERLCDGREDPQRLRCCNSGCFVCVLSIQAIVAELSERDPSAPGTDNG